MSAKNDFSKTMRIDVHPDFLGEALQRRMRKTESGGVVDDESAAMLRGVSEGSISDFDKLLQSIYDAVFITDSIGNIVDFNTRALDFFMVSHGRLSEMNIVDLISGADSALLTSIKKNLEDQRYTLIESYCVRYDESMFPSEIAVNRINLDGHARLCFFVRDISVRKRAQDALEEAVTHLEAHDRARSQFISNVSHELRTPLTSMIYAVANMLKGVVGPLPKEIRHYLEILNGDTKRLLATVNDILDLRKIEDKTLTLAKTRIPFSRLVRRTAESLRVQADQKMLAFNISIDNRRWFVHCDAQKMERVVLNIVGNAIKFTPDNGTVNVVVQDDPERRNHVLLTVQDDGIGIPPVAVNKVMERYFTVGEQSSGSGLGLAISKEIVELHGGAITIKSPPPAFVNGTIVSISMPTVDAPLILIADDEKAVLSLIEYQIKENGYRVVTAENGVEALKKIEENNPDAVILDMAMPQMSGTEVILKIKSDKNRRRMPIIVITGANVDRSKAEILRSFSIPALSKPWDESELLDRLAGAFLGRAALI
ncbi:ATP-binding protein [Verrucomicrobiota bacterium]